MSVLAEAGEKLKAVEKCKTGRRGEGETNCGITPASKILVK